MSLLARWANESDLVVKVCGVSNKLTVLQHLHVDHFIDIEPSVQRRPGLRNSALQVTTVDVEGKDVEDAQVDLPQPAVYHTPAVAATSCSSQWRRDARVLRSPPFGPLPLRTLSPPTLVREYLFFFDEGS